MQAQTAAAASVTRGGVILPPAVAANIERAKTSTVALGVASKATKAQLGALATTSIAGGAATKSLSTELHQAETAAGRYTRGMVAATAASTGLFRAVSFASGAFLIGAGVGAAIGAAVQEFKNMTIVAAQTTALIKATGGAANVTADQVDKLAKSQLNLTGVDDELVKQAANIILTFKNIRNETGPLNDIFSRTVKAVQDIATVMGVDLISTARQVGKALQDPATGLTALRRQGITFSDAQRKVIKALFDTGQTLKAQRLVLAGIEQQVGGTARAVGRTLPGQLNILRERAKNALGEYVKRITESKTATEGFSQTVGGLGDAIKTVATTVGLLVAPLAAAVGTLTKFLVATGALRELVKIVATAAITFGALKLALGAVSIAQRTYTSFTTIATAATIAEGTAAEAAALKMGASAAAATAAGTAAATTAARVSIGAAALAALKGPLGITIALTAATVVAFKLKKALDSMPGTIKGFNKALDPLQQSLGRAATLQQQLAAATENVALARANIGGAGAGVVQAQRALRASTAQPGSLERQDLVIRLSQALQKQRDAEAALRTAEASRAAIERQLAANEKARPAVIENTTRAIRKQIDTLVGLRQNIIRGPVGEGATFGADLPTANEQIQKLTDRLRTLATSGNALKRNIAVPLLGIIETLKRLPTAKEVAIVFKLAGQGKAAEQIRQALGFGLLDIQRPILNIEQQQTAAIQQQAAAARLLIKTEEKKLSTLRETLATRRSELKVQQDQVASAKASLQAARDSRISALQGLADAQRGLADSQRALRDTIVSSHQAIQDAIRSSRQTINQSVQDAKANLATLSAAIADAKANFLQAGGGQAQTGSLGARFRAFRDRVLAGQGGPETARQGSQIAFKLNAPQANVDKVRQQFADLTDSFVRGKISLPQFNKQFNALIKGLDLKKFSQLFGTAATNELLDQIRTLRAQAVALAKGPQRPGGALAQVLIKPLSAVAQGSRDIAAARRQATRDIASARRDMADAQRQVVRSQREIARADREIAGAERRLRAAQTRETKANTAAIKANTAANKELARVNKAKAASEDTPKPRGGAGAAANQQVNQGAVLP